MDPRLEHLPAPVVEQIVLRELEFGEEALREYQETRLRFFDHYLKEEDTWSDQPTVEYFQMGTGDGSRSRDGRLFHGGEWRSGEEWPLPDTEFESYYVHADGRLSTEKPTVDDASTTYTFDPRDPVPTVGGNCSSYITYEQREENILEYPLSERKMVDLTGRGGFDQRTRPDTLGAEAPYGPLEERDDVLVYRSEPLEEDLEIAGPIRVRVYGSTDGPDTDFTAKLIDEHPPSEEFPNGAAINLCDSICRGRYRGYRDEPDLLEPGEVYEFEMEPYPTANVFKEGHRIRLDISSSNYPRYDVNHNTGGPLYGDREYRTATNTVHHDAEFATHVELPIQPVNSRNIPLSSRYLPVPPSRVRTRRASLPSPRPCRLPSRRRRRRARSCRSAGRCSSRPTPSAFRSRHCAPRGRERSPRRSRWSPPVRSPPGKSFGSPRQFSRLPSRSPRCGRRPVDGIGTGFDRSIASLDRGHRLLDPGSEILEVVGDLGNGRFGLVGQSLDLVGDDAEAVAGFVGVGGLNVGVQRE